MMKAGKFYKYYYEVADSNKDAQAYKCIFVENGWATLQRMSRDHAGRPKPYSHVIEVNADETGEVIEVDYSVLSYRVYSNSEGKGVTPGDGKLYNFHIGEISIQIDNTSNQIISTTFQNYS